MADIVYKEWVPAGKLVKLLVGFVSLVSAFTLLVVTVFAISLALVMAAILVPTLAFIGFMFWNYRGLEIEMNSNELQVDYGLFNRKRVSLSDIDSCEPTKASFWKYGGVGVRCGVDGSRAYTTSFGDAIKLNLQRGHPFIFSTNNPDEICKLIRACS